MPTKHPRVNIILEESIVNLLSHLAQQEHTTVSSLAKKLVLEALDRREDRVLSAIAETRDKPKAKKVKHDDVWK